MLAMKNDSPINPRVSLRTSALHPAQHVVERPVLFVKDDDVLDARVRRDRSAEQHLALKPNASQAKCLSSQMLSSAALVASTRAALAMC